HSSNPAAQNTEHINNKSSRRLAYQGLAWGHHCSTDRASYFRIFLFSLRDGTINYRRGGLLIKAIGTHYTLDSFWSFSLVQKIDNMGDESLSDGDLCIGSWHNFVDLLAFATDAGEQVPLPVGCWPAASFAFHDQSPYHASLGCLTLRLNRAI